MPNDNSNSDLSGEKLTDIDPKFSVFFKELHDSSVELESKRKELMQALVSKVQEFRQKIQPQLMELANDYEPKIKSVIRDLERLKLDLDSAWDTLYEEYPYYKNRTLSFDHDEEVFRFGQEPRPQALLEFILRPLQEDMGPLGDLIDPKEFLEGMNGDEGFEIPE